ncbi:MAG: 5-(carboxyamino)imidazole ribonucleotide synthase [Cyclobacteriaceae bacterium]|nr:5-(carboxyamino)imidazole ribonucleotide synthase [Cyclobacteriaceae bacterium]
MTDVFNNYKIGILGGGQLGRMLIKTGMNLGLDFKAMDPDKEAPIKKYIHDFTPGKLTDYKSVLEWGKDCNLITIEIENVNTEALKELEKQGKTVYPQPHIIELIKDKSEQKKFYKNNGIPTAPFELVENKKDVEALKTKIPFVNKLAREGYDGRGVQIIITAKDLAKAFDAPGIVEELIPFEKEISVLVARGVQGETKTFPVVEMVFHPEHNLVEYLFAPAEISLEIEKKAQEIAIDVINKLDMIGLLAVEMFVTKEGEVLVNEVAPRPHNSGHQTIEANVTSQYEQHLRAILGLPLGDTTALISSAMVNLLGEDGYQGPAKYEGLGEVMKENGVHVHLYGKAETRPFRKMGHVTITDSNTQELKRKANFVKNTLKVIA